MTGGSRGPVTGWGSKTQKGPNWNERRRIDNWHGAYSYIYFNITLSDEQGLSVNERKTITINPDPLIFDLNEDGKVEMTGAQKIENATYIPPGLWDINPNSVPNDYRYVVADTNNNNGVQVASISVNSSGRWGIAIEKRNANGDWEALKATSSFTETSGTVSADGVVLNLTRTSDGGYVNDGKGVESAGGDMVEFDMDPLKSSWSKQLKNLSSGTWCSNCSRWLCRV